MNVASPCNKICQLHPASGWCLGCQRSDDEIASWTVTDEAERRAVLADRAQRASALGMPGPTRS